MRKVYTLIIVGFFMAGISFFTSCKKEVIIQTVTVRDTVKIIAPTPTPPIDSLTIGLIAYYPFDNSGVDMSGNGNHGLINNMTGTSDRTGKANAAYHFDGYTSYIVVPDNQALRLANINITLSTWVKLEAYGTSYGSNILTKHIIGSNNGWAWGITGSAYTPTGVVTYGPGGASLLGTGSKVIPLNQWHMVTSVYTLSTQQLSIYVDGVLNTTSNSILSPSSAISADLYIGRDNPGVSPNGYFLQGSLDEVRIYNRLLSLNDIQRLYTYKN